MTKDRINRDELADKLVEQAAEAEDPLRTARVNDFETPSLRIY